MIPDPPAWRFHQRQQRHEKPGIGVGDRFAAPTGAPGPAQRWDAGLQLGHSLRYPGTRHARRTSHRGDPAMTQRAGLAGHHQSLLPLVQMR